MLASNNNNINDNNNLLARQRPTRRLIGRRDQPWEADEVANVFYYQLSTC